MKKQKFYVFVVMYFTKILGVAHYFLFGIWFDSCAYVSYFQKLIFCWKRQQIKHILSVQVWYCMWNCKINNKMLRWLPHEFFDRSDLLNYRKIFVIFFFFIVVAVFFYGLLTWSIWLARDSIQKKKNRKKLSFD